MNLPESHPQDAVLNEYLDGMLPSEESAALESHLERCANCRQRLADLRRVFSSLSDLPEAPLAARSFGASDRNAETEADAEMNHRLLRGSGCSAHPLLSLSLSPGCRHSQPCFCSSCTGSRSNTRFSRRRRWIWLPPGRCFCSPSWNWCGRF